MKNSQHGKKITIVGAGLAGSELALYLAQRGLEIRLIDMKPNKMTPAHINKNFAELVCSNSFRGASLTNAVGLLKEEMVRAGSFIMKAAQQTKVPAGGAWAVDREKFANTITSWIFDSPNIHVEEKLVEKLPEDTNGITVIATGPLTDTKLSEDLHKHIGNEHLYFYDAIAPIISADSIDYSKVFFASRYDKGDSNDYLNIPLSESEYKQLIAQIISAEKVLPHNFEKERYFEGCLPIEVMAKRGEMTLAFGPMKPVGIIDPKTGKRPFAVIQLRKENKEGTAYNMVGFQTKMTYPEQKKLIRSLPGLENAEILRYGSIHRNMFINSPVVLDDKLKLKSMPHIRFAGQITGVEGYVESAAIGLLNAIFIYGEIIGTSINPPPETCALGALFRHLRYKKEEFQPSNIHFGMFPPINKRLRGKAKKEEMAKRALADLQKWLKTLPN